MTRALWLEVCVEIACVRASFHTCSLFQCPTPTEEERHRWRVLATPHLRGRGVAFTGEWRGGLSDGSDISGRWGGHNDRSMTLSSYKKRATEIKYFNEKMFGLTLLLKSVKEALINNILIKIFFSKVPQSWSRTRKKCQNGRSKCFLHLHTENQNKT